MERYTLYSLLQKYDVIIPQIQRDYAQGREDKKSLRRDFLDNLLNVLSSDSHKELNKELNLDFVYGYIENGTCFYPLDGQQRLTTLWLLYWFLCPIEKLDKSCAWLSKFSYRTRITATRFCEKLVEKAKDIKTAPSEEVSNMITELPWFRVSWHQDPTVKGMLVVLDAIQNLTEGFDKALLWHRLVEDQRIGFYLLDIKSEQFRLTDELYIKMNARGKELTAWECYKADLIGNLMDHYKKSSLNFEGQMVSYSDYYAINIDTTEWTDLFWSTEDDGTSMNDRLLNFHQNMARLCFYRTNKEDKSFDYRNPSIWNTQEHLDFLINTLQIFSAIAKKNGGIDGYFKELFSELRLFGESNLFAQIQEENLEVPQLILFLCLVEYLRKFGDSSPIDFIRICRNFLAYEWQRKETKFVSDIRLNSLSDYWNKLGRLLDRSDVYALQSDGEAIVSRHEDLKAKIIVDNSELKKCIHKLEDHQFFFGNLRNLHLKDNIDKIEGYCTAVYEVWNLDNKGNNSISNSLISRAMIATGFVGVYIRSILSNAERAVLLGDNDWYRILTNEYLSTVDLDEAYKLPYLNQFLDSYLKAKGTTPEEKLQDIIDAALGTVDKGNWKYYFLNYEEFTEYNDKNALYYSNPQCFESRKLNSVSSNPTLAYHISPYVQQAVKQINDMKISDNVYNWSIGYEKSGIVLEHGRENAQGINNKQVEIKSDKKGWRITLGEGNEEACIKAVKTFIETNYKYSEMSFDGDAKYQFLVHCEPTDDRVEVGAQLAKELKQVLI